MLDVDLTLAIVRVRDRIWVQVRKLVRCKQHETLAAPDLGEEIFLFVVVCRSCDTFRAYQHHVGLYFVTASQYTRAVRTTGLTRQIVNDVR